MTLASLTPIANHIWQSTLFAAAAGLLTLAFRKNRAPVRYALWLAASLKFLFPFSLLVSLGSQVEWRRAPAPHRLYSVVQGIARPFVRSVPSTTLPSPAVVSHALPYLLIGIWLLGAAAGAFVWARQWLRVRRTVRTASRFPLTLSVPVLSSPSRLEPGVFGIFRPVLLMPAGITDRLPPSQLQAILAHELCHVRRRDNLTAALHMLVETLFWFHPLVWWLRTRLAEERERACDEAVLETTAAPLDYAESLLSVCKFYMESPLICAAGVTGSNLKQRIREIMLPRAVQSLNSGRKALLAAAAIATVATPVLIGIVNAPAVRAQSKSSAPLSFEVASVKPNTSLDPHFTLGFESTPAGRFTIHNSSLSFIISSAYDVPFQSPRLSGGPEWIHSETFDIDARAPEGSVTGLTHAARNAKMALMLQSLLADRFQLVVRRETKDIPVYVLTMGKSGLKLHKAALEEKDCNDAALNKGIACHAINGGIGRGLHGKAVDIADIVLFVENWSDRPVLDKTGLQGLYEIDTEGWAPMLPRNPTADHDEGMSDPTRPTLAMIFDRVGLKLEQQKGPVETFTIEHVSHPSGN